MHQLFYVTLDPEKALGVEDLIPSYHILYSEPSQLSLPIANNGADIKNFPKSRDLKFNSTSKMLEDEALIEYIKENSFKETPDVIVFKNDERIFKNAKNLNVKLINADFELNRKLENKIEFAKFVDEVKIFKQPEYEVVTKLSDVNFDACEKKFGHDFIIQFIFGHTGSTTFFVNSKTQLDELKVQYPNRMAKISKKIEGVPYTVNACITKIGIVVGGLSEQITGIKELTPAKGGTVGNDYSQRHLNDDIRRNIVEKTMQIGEKFMELGHKGIFGLDFIVEENTGELLLIEANMRQTASSSYTSYLQRMNNQVPIMLWHTLELLDFNFDTKFDCLDDSVEEILNEGIQSFKNAEDKIAWNIGSNQPINASQIFFRNLNDYPVTILDQFPSGIYRMRGRMPNESADLEDGQDYPVVFKLREDGWSTLCMIKRGYNILEAAVENGFLIFAAPEKGIIAPLSEMGRIQVLESAFASKEGNDLNGWVIDVVNAVYENVRAVKVESF